MASRRDRDTAKKASWRDERDAAYEQQLVPHRGKANGAKVCQGRKDFWFFARRTSLKDMPIPLVIEPACAFILPSPTGVTILDRPRGSSLT